MITESEQVYCINGYWKNDESKFENYLVTNKTLRTSKVLDEAIFYYGVNGENMTYLSTVFDDNLEFVVTSSYPATLTRDILKRPVTSSDLVLELWDLQRDESIFLAIAALHYDNGGLLRVEPPDSYGFDPLWLRNDGDGIYYDGRTWSDFSCHSSTSPTLTQILKDTGDIIELFDEEKL